MFEPQPPPEAGYELRIFTPDLYIVENAKNALYLLFGHEWPDRVRILDHGELDLHRWYLTNGTETIWSNGA